MSAVSAWRAVHERGLEHDALVSGERQISHWSHKVGFSGTHPLAGSRHETTQLSSFFCPQASVRFIELPDWRHC